MDPTCRRLPETRFALEGLLAEYLERVTAQWLVPAPAANPAMLEMFRDRDRRPLRNMMPWAGEFAGKYLTSAVQIWRLTRDPGLRAVIAGFVAELVRLQDADGYLGPWPRGHRLTGQAPNVGGQTGSTWDAWGHYHVCLGLLLWHGESGDAEALACAGRIGDLFCRRFLGRKKLRLVDTGSTEMNLAPVHALCLLYHQTGEARYLKLARQIVEEFAATGPDGPLAGDYLRTALAGTPFYQTPKPRWESLHPIMGLAELYWITGEEDFRRAYEHIWWSIVELDRHNNGGFSSGEQAQGNPYHQGAIETCCTIAWMAASVEMLRLTGDPVVADELELSTLNSAIGLHSQSGRWVTYNTPMDGVRRASAHEIVFQAREGTPELNCCSVNGPRGLGLVSEWALMADDDGLLLNWYGPSTLTTRVKGATVALTQQTEYPREGRVALKVKPSRPVTLALKLRIPYWSARTRVRLNGEPVRPVAPGSYLVLERQWTGRERLELDLDFSLHYWVGEQECAGMASAYRGPLLLTYDRRFNDVDPDQVPVLDAARMAGRDVAAGSWLEPHLLLQYPAAGGRALRLCDFASAGEAGSPYRSWLKVRGIAPTPFSRKNPLRSGRPR